MIILNFSHPLTDEQIRQIEQLSGMAVSTVHTIPCQFDNEQPFVPQVEAILEKVPLSAEEWQITSLLINPAAYAPITAVLLAELHGRTGHFPTVIRIRPVPGSVPTQFEVAELINLQTVRAEARSQRN